MKKQSNNKSESLEQKPICGIVMPISTLDGCTAEHWIEVQEIIKSVISEAELTPNLVSDSDDVGVVQGRIVQNLYNYPIVICDVSGKNPNVMFELGMRLAFDKPTVIIKDDRTDYSFDTSPIEHIPYPRDLRFNKILLFKEKLKNKLLATLKKSVEDPSYSPFLKHFGEFVVPKLEQKEVSFNDFIVDSLNNIKDEISRLKSNTPKKKEVTSSSIKMESVEERDGFMRRYLDQLRTREKNPITNKEGLKRTTFSYLNSWKDLGYSEQEVNDLFEKYTLEFSN